MKPAAWQVAVVIVTFNRQRLLQRCVAAVRAQSRPPERIFVIDNGSSDGTSEWLGTEKGLDVIRQGNGGSAGGQATGITAAAECGADWVWCMDDDGHPERECLEQLLARGEGLDVVAPAVLDEQQPENLGFSLYVPETGESLTTVDQVERRARGGVIPGACNPFNGILVRRSVVARIGVPMRELFIWGDEVEYILRVQRAGLRVGLVAAARFFHPRMKIKTRQWWLAGRREVVQASKINMYCLARNNVCIAREYYGWIRVLKVVVLTLGGRIATRDIMSARIELAGILDGLAQRWGGERKFLS